MTVTIGTRDLIRINDSLQVQACYPDIQWNHVDGPLLHLTDGGTHWLTWWERFMLFIGETTIEELDFKHSKASAEDKKYIYDRWGCKG